MASVRSIVHLNGFLEVSIAQGGVDPVTHYLFQFLSERKAREFEILFGQKIDRGSKRLSFLAGIAKETPAKAVALRKSLRDSSLDKDYKRAEDAILKHISV